MTTNPTLSMARKARRYLGTTTTVYLVELNQYGEEYYRTEVLDIRIKRNGHITVLCRAGGMQPLKAHERLVIDC